ncbi:MAG TPA: PilX N-terminal domain-containing pilus assembly protein, partial [Blastocatellia bacterium]|nr:PilX N-terminal domain-containing pilus assembly protein [Blastocatellia bacterium]
MKITHRASFEKERGIALVTTLMLSLLLSVLVGGMLVASTSDTIIGSNDVRNNQAFYIAEAGINRSAAWFTASFGSTASSGLPILPEKYLDPITFMGKNEVGVLGKLSYTTGEANYNTPPQIEDAPHYTPGASVFNPISHVWLNPIPDSEREQAIPTSVKTPPLVTPPNTPTAILQNVVLAGDSTNTFPTPYTVEGLNAAGVPTTYTFSNVVSGFKSNLVDQQVGDGRFTVKAILISIPPDTGGGSGMVTWLLKSEGKLMNGSSTMASAT